MAFVMHNAINWKWIKQVTLNLFNRKIPFKTKFGYIIDLLLLIAMSYIIISGIFISKILFPNLQIGNELFFKISHISISYLVLILLGIHIGLHWKWAINNLKKMFKLTKEKKILIFTTRLMVILILIFSVYTLYTKNFVSRVAGIGIFFGIEQPQPKRNIQLKNGNNNKPALSENNKTNTFSGENNRHFIDKKNMPKVNIADLIISIFSILAFFVIITYYLEKFFSKKQNIYRKKYTDA